MPPHPLVDLAINSFVTFFVIIDPIGLIGIFNGLTQGMGRAARLSLAVRGNLIGAGILFLFAIGGEWMLGVLGISLPAFRAAGGAMLFMIALEMTFQDRGTRRAETAQDACAETRVEDIAIFPLGIPLIAGPGAITSTLLLASRHKGSLVEQAIVLGAILAVLALTFGTFVMAERLGRIIGRTVAGITARLFGILLAAVAVEYMVVGIRQIWTAG
jgi:multiple antibiotic resistance protein